MNRTLGTGGRELEHQILEALQERISAFGDDSEIRAEETADGGIEILTAWFDRFGEHKDAVMGEFLFRDNPDGGPGGRYFCSVLTLASDMPIENIPDLSLALSVINFYIETGCFALNKPADLLVYRNTRTFSGDVSEEALRAECITEMEQAYETAAKYSTVVLALAEGSLMLEEFMALLATE
ncbi:MAG: hypothetical protein Q4A32_09215 [Lachnospiraceae bacterium]|nr:hypothetical protein [Lachnospiraceae bacterium]